MGLSQRLIKKKPHPHRRCVLCTTCAAHPCSLPSALLSPFLSRLPSPVSPFLPSRLSSAFNPLICVIRDSDNLPTPFALLSSFIRSLCPLPYSRFSSPVSRLAIFKEVFMQYDPVPKYLLQGRPEDVLHFMLGHANFEVIAVLETEQPTVEVRRTDSLIRVRIDGQDVLVHCEFQTGDSTAVPMDRRMARYIGYLIERYGLPVLAFVIYLRPNAGRRDKGYYNQALPGHEMLVKYKVIRLSELDGQSVIESGHAGVLPFAPLMKPPSDVSSEAWLRACFQATEALALDTSTKLDIQAGMGILSGLSHRLDTVRRIMSQEGFMDAIMRESSFAQYLKEQGIEQGMERGIEQGERESTIANVLDVLEIRFDAAAAGQFADRIRSIADLQHLKRLLRSAVQVDDIEEFQRLLDAEA